jgi:hypothetical protein
MGAQQLLDWLFREYWQKQVKQTRLSISKFKSRTAPPLITSLLSAGVLLPHHTQALDLEQSSIMAARLLSGYKTVALRAQEESPNALSRACR